MRSKDVRTWTRTIEVRGRSERREGTRALAIENRAARNVVIALPTARATHTRKEKSRSTFRFDLGGGAKPGQIAYFGFTWVRSKAIPLPQNSTCSGRMEASYRDY